VKLVDQNKKSIGLNVTSLIDVLFILLIFFMVTSNFIEQPGMKLELPETKTQEVARVEQLTIFVSKDGEIFLNDQPVELSELSGQLNQYKDQENKQTLILKADRAASHGLIVQIMDVAKQMGLSKIVIGTRTESGSSS
jgi:biopolymer transport protein ExbD